MYEVSCHLPASHTGHVEQDLPDIYTGFAIQVSGMGGGGMVSPSPLREGTQGEGRSHRGGGMTRDTNVINKHNIFVYQEDVLEK